MMMVIDDVPVTVNRSAEGILLQYYSHQSKKESMNPFIATQTIQIIK